MGAAVAAIAIALTAGACRVDVSVAIDADDAGGGQVEARARLDGSAVTQLGGPEPGERLRLEDLGRAGWEIEGPTPQDDGGLEIVATHDFASPEEARALIGDLAGDPGPLRNFELRQRRSFLRTTTEFDATVDLQDGLGAFADPDLQEALGATTDAPLGVTTEALERRFGADLDRLLGVQVAVRLPGDVESNALTETGSGAVWAPALGEQIVLEATSQRWNVANIAGATVATLSGLGLAGLAVGRRRRQRRENLTVTDGNSTVSPHGETGEDRRGASGPTG